MLSLHSYALLHNQPPYLSRFIEQQSKSKKKDDEEKVIKIKKKIRLTTTQLHRRLQVRSGGNGGGYESVKADLPILPPLPPPDIGWGCSTCIYTVNWK